MILLQPPEIPAIRIGKYFFLVIFTATGGDIMNYISLYLDAGEYGLTIDITRNEQTAGWNLSRLINIDLN